MAMPGFCHILKNKPILNIATMIISVKLVSVESTRGSKSIMSVKKIGHFHMQTPSPTTTHAARPTFSCMTFAY
jgi:hypothetical protein